jgi:aspartate kinase
MIVMKFGGTSVGSAERIREVYRLVTERLPRDPVVVVSAVGGVTDLLIAAAKKALYREDSSTLLAPIRERHDRIVADLGIDVASGSGAKPGWYEAAFAELANYLDGIRLIQELSPRTLDAVCSFGERLSSSIIAEYFRTRGTPSLAYFGWEAGIVTDDDFGEAEILPETYDEIPKRLAMKRGIPIVTGFIAKNRAGIITTLGRGGSDYTASILGAGLGAEEIQIWTDVDGVLTTDPRIVPQARSIPEVSFTEAAELAFFGAKVLHPKTIFPAVARSIPVRVLNTHNPEHPGTVIVEKTTSERQYTAISCKKNVTVVRIVSTRMLLAYGFLARIFEIFKRYEISVDMVATSEVSVSLTLDNTENLGAAITELGDFSTVEVHNGCAAVCVVGPGIMTATDSPGTIFSVCARAGIRVEMIAQGASQVNISFVIAQGDAERCVKALHAALFEGAIEEGALAAGAAQGASS